MWEGVTNWSQGETEYREEIILLGDKSENNCGSVVIITCKAYLFWGERWQFLKSQLVNYYKYIFFFNNFYFSHNTLYLLCKHGVSTHMEDQSIPKFLAPGGKTVVPLFMCVSLRGGLVQSFQSNHFMKARNISYLATVFFPAPKFPGNQRCPHGFKKWFMCEGTLEISLCSCQQEQVCPMTIFIPIHLDSWPGQNPMPHSLETCSQVGPCGASL